MAEGSANGSSRWQLIASFGAVAFLICSAFIGLLYTVWSTSSAVSNLNARLDTAEQRINTMANTVNEQRAEMGTFKSGLAVFEAQLCAESQVRNMMHSKAEAEIETLWVLTQKSSRVSDRTYPLTGCFQSER